MMNCSDTQAWLRRDLDGDAEPSSEVAEHLDRCPSCAAEAGRFKALSEAARAALPPAAVPIDFVDRVMDTLVEPTGEAALMEAVRPRRRQRLLFLGSLVAVVLLTLHLWPAAPGRDLLLESGVEGRAGPLAYTAVEPSLLREGDPLELVAGSLLVQSSAATTLRTALGDVRLGAGSECLIRVSDREESSDMTLNQLKRMAPAFLAVTVLAGSATVANAQGEQPVKQEETAEVRGETAPVVNEAAVTRELQIISEALARIHERIALLGRRLQRLPDAQGALLAEQRKLLDAAQARLFRAGIRREVQAELDKHRERIATLRELLEGGGKVPQEVLEDARRAIQQTHDKIALLNPKESKAGVDELRRLVLELGERRAQGDILREENQRLKRRVQELENRFTLGKANSDKRVEYIRFLMDQSRKRLEEINRRIERTTGQGVDQGELLDERRERLRELARLEAALGTVKKPNVVDLEARYKSYSKRAEAMREKLKVFMVPGEQGTRVVIERDLDGLRSWLNTYQKLQVLKERAATLARKGERDFKMEGQIESMEKWLRDTSDVYGPEKDREPNPPRRR